MDNGPEMTAHALRDWCQLSKTGTVFIEPGSPWQNPFVESFHSRVRDELLDVEEFSCLAEARVVIGDWREDYNRRRPHSALGMRTPATFAAQYAASPTDRKAAASFLVGSRAPPSCAPLGAALEAREPGIGQLCVFLQLGRQARFALDENSPLLRMRQAGECIQLIQSLPLLARDRYQRGVVYRRLEQPVGEIVATRLPISVPLPGAQRSDSQIPPVAFADGL